MKPIASISLQDTRVISLDVDEVSRIEISVPIQVEEGLWCGELFIRTSNGTVALQLVSDDPEKLKAIVLDR